MDSVIQLFEQPEPDQLFSREKWKKKNVTNYTVVCYTAVFSLVPQRSAPPAVRVESKKGGVAVNYLFGGANIA